NAIQNAGAKVRSAAAHAYQALLVLASAQLGQPVSALSVTHGVVSGGGKSVTYGQLVGDKLLNASIATPQLSPGAGIAKPVAQYKLVGTRFPRKTIADKVTGRYAYVHDIYVPGMPHGRVARPRGQGGSGTGAPIPAIDVGTV